MAKFSVGQYLGLGGYTTYEVIQITGVYSGAYVPYYTYTEIYNLTRPEDIGKTYTGAIDVIDADYQVVSWPPSPPPPPEGGFSFEMLLPMMPNEGPPLPRFLGIYWPWYKPT